MGVVSCRAELNGIRVDRGCLTGLVNRRIASYFNIMKVMPHGNGRAVCGHFSGDSLTSAKVGISNSNSDVSIRVRVVIACNVGVGTVTIDVARGMGRIMVGCANLSIDEMDIGVSNVGRWSRAICLGRYVMF